VLHMVPLTIYSLQKIKQIHTVYTLDVWAVWITEEKQGDEFKNLSWK
jgi:hypothetical protein